MSEKPRFNLNALVPEEELEKARQAGREARKWYEEVEWRRQNDPNFEEWYAEECQRIHDECESMTVDKTISELEEMYKRYRGL